MCYHHNQVRWYYAHVTDEETNSGKLNDLPNVNDNNKWQSKIQTQVLNLHSSRQRPTF